MPSLRAREVRRSLIDNQSKGGLTPSRSLASHRNRKEVGMTAAGECLDLNSTSRFLGFTPQHLFYLVENPSRHYTRIRIPKNSNPQQFRVLDIPSTDLKGVQRSILKKILDGTAVGECVHSYVQGRSIISAANKLCPGRAVLNIDIENFFPSITFVRILGLFKSLGFNDKSSFMLSRLTTKDNCLAQGAPTSPMLSNLVMRNLDLRLTNLATAWELEYIRYSDDMFFHKERNFNHPRLAQIVYEMIERSGFGVNLNKTKYHPKGLPRITLGLLTHGDRPKIPGSQRRLYRSLFFKASRNIHWAHENRDRLGGTLEWYKCVYGRDETYFQYRTVLDNVARLRLHDTYQSR